MKIIRIFLFLVCFVFTGNLSGQESVQKLILGTWVFLDNDWTFSFSPDGICREYSGGELISTNSYILTYDTPPCGADHVHADGKTLYLSLTDLTTGGDIICYQVDGLDNQGVSLSPVWTGGFNIFVHSLSDTVTMTPPFKALSCTVANRGVNVSLKMSFYAKPGLRPNGQYSLGNIPPDLRPDEAHQLTVQGGGCTWNVVITPEGDITAVVVKGTPPPAGQPIDLDEIHYQLFEPIIGPDKE